MKKTVCARTRKESEAGTKAMSESYALPVKITSLMMVVVFAFSLLAPVPVEASVVSPASNVMNTHQNPLASKINLEFPEIPQYQITSKKGDGITKIYLDYYDTTKVHSISESANGKTFTVRYIYDSTYDSVTLLLSVTENGKSAKYANYYRYALGPNNSLELILEEGFVKDGYLIPAHFYDYYSDSVRVRFFNKEGQLTRLDSSDGYRNYFFYSSLGKLLTVKEVGPTGDVNFYDQLFASSHKYEPHQPYLDVDSLIYVMPNRDKAKRLGFLSFKNPNLDLSLNIHYRDLISVDMHQRFLEWLMAAHPFRAGPGVGGNLL